MTKTVDESWRRIEAHLGAADVEATTGATDAAIADAEAQVGVLFPEAFRRSLERHDGLGQDARPLLYGTTPCSVASLLASWRFMVEWAESEDVDFDEARPRGVRGDRWWRRGWLPIADGDGDYLVLDLDPDEGGTSGQVFSFTRLDGPARVAAPSYAAWLELWAEDLDRRAPAYNASEEDIDAPGEHCVVWPTNPPWPGEHTTPAWAAIGLADVPWDADTGDLERLAALLGASATITASGPVRPLTEAGFASLIEIAAAAVSIELVYDEAVISVTASGITGVHVLELPPAGETP